MVAIITCLILILTIIEPSAIGDVSVWFESIMKHFADAVPDITQKSIAFSSGIEVPGIAQTVGSMTAITGSLVVLASIFQCYLIIKRGSEKGLLSKTAEVFTITVLLTILIGPFISSATVVTKDIRDAIIKTETVITPMTAIIKNEQADLEISRAKVQEKMTNISKKAAEFSCLTPLNRIQDCLGGLYQSIFSGLDEYVRSFATWAKDNLAELIAITAYTGAIVTLAVAFIGKTALLLVLFALSAVILPFFIFDGTRSLVSSYLKLILKLILLHPFVLLMIYFSTLIATTFNGAFSNNPENKLGLIISALVFATITLLTKNIIQIIGKEVSANIKTGTAILTTGLSSASSELLSFLGNKLNLQSINLKSNNQEVTSKHLSKADQSWQGSSFAQLKKIGGPTSGENAIFKEVKIETPKAPKITVERNAIRETHSKTNSINYQPTKNSSKDIPSGEMSVSNGVGLKEINQKETIKQGNNSKKSSGAWSKPERV